MAFGGRETAFRYFSGIVAIQVLSSGEIFSLLVVCWKWNYNHTRLLVPLSNPFLLSFDLTSMLIRCDDDYLTIST
jgi:hypothetical protein